MTPRQRLGWVFLLCLTAAVYWPGLKGPFLFDDFSNLALLADAGRLDRPDNVVRYILSGFSGPTGRPLAMASFIPEAGYWPHDPFPFKRTNLLLHLANMVLLAAVTRRLLKSRGVDTAQAQTIAWLSAALWGLHPLWVSTTLYVVQRMTLLATLFALLGLLLHLVGRETLLIGRPRRGAALMAAGIYGMGLLATLSKESGALLPLLILVVERYALAPHRPLPPAAQRLVLALAGLPAFAVVVYLLHFLPAVFAGETMGRDFTAGERLLTEGRVLLRYLGSLFLPRAEGGGLYGQEVSLSQGLLSPWTTLAAWAALAASWWLAERLRTRQVTVALAITFFLTGHLMESTWVPLELAFEHRNYLPALFLFLPVAQAIAAIDARRWRQITALALLCALAALTLVRADLWGRPFAQALTWARQHPESPRAQAHLAALWLASGNDEEAARLLDAALARRPTDLLLALNRLLAACATQLQPHHVRLAASAIEVSPLNHRVSQYQIQRLLEYLRAGHCGVGSRAAFDTLWQAAWERAQGDARFRSVLLQERALLKLTYGEVTQAVQEIEAALALDPRPDTQLGAAALLAGHGAFAEALQLLDRKLAASSPRSLDIQGVREWWLRRSGYWEKERAHLRARIRADWQASALPGAAGSVNLGPQ